MFNKRPAPDTAANEARKPMFGNAKRIFADSEVVREIPLARIERNSVLQMRVATNPEVVAAYAEKYSRERSDDPPPDERPLPSPVVFEVEQGKYLLADGWHRIAALEKLGVASARFSVREGTLADAAAFAAQTNSRHGLPMTNADKQHAIRKLWELFPKKSARQIGALVGVDHKTAQKYNPNPPTPPAGTTTLDHSGGAGGEIPQRSEGAATSDAAGAATNEAAGKESDELRRLKDATDKLRKLAAAWKANAANEDADQLASALEILDRIVARRSARGETR